MRAARPGGLGAAVSEVLPGGAAWGLAAGCAVAALAVGAAFHGWTGVRFLAAGAAALLCAELVLRRCLTRLSGVTGDVFGALCETAVTAALLVLSLR